MESPTLRLYADFGLTMKYGGSEMYNMFYSAEGMVY